MSIQLSEEILSTQGFVSNTCWELSVALTGSVLKSAAGERGGLVVQTREQHVVCSPHAGVAGASIAFMLM